MYNEKEIEAKILELRSELKTDRLDMSFGEIMNLYDDGDLIITPEYQRAYRWHDEQKTRFIESILLGIPIPPIFVAEDDSGRWELVDGLQRISTILSFFGKLKNDLDNKNFFKLIDTELTDNYLKDIDVNKLSSKLKRTITRAVCRVEILRWDSEFDMRYELFNRLNTGSSPLKEQEIRNCIFTGSFNKLLHELAENEIFKSLIEPTEKQKQEMFMEELVLRYFAFIDMYNDLIIEKSIQVYLTNYMKEISKNFSDEKDNQYRENFLKVIDILQGIDNKIFRAKNGLFTPNKYDTIMYLSYKYFEDIKDNLEIFEQKLRNIFEHIDYKEASGASTYATQRMKKKIEIADKLYNKF